MKTRILSLAIALITFFTFGIASAIAPPKPHFIKNKQSKTDLGTQLEVCYKIAGLGNNEIVYIKIESTGALASADCTNPGGNVAPGQATAVTASALTGPVSADDNGNIDRCDRTLTPSLPSTPTCPNNQWTPTVTDVEFNGTTTIYVYSNSNYTGLIVSYTF